MRVMGLALAFAGMATLGAAPAPASEPKQPRVEVGRGAFLRGPLILRDDAGNTLLSLRAGEVLGGGGLEGGCVDTLTVQHGRKVQAREVRPPAEGSPGTHRYAAAPVADRDRT
jgi:hypothetical protein